MKYARSDVWKSFQSMDLPENFGMWIAEACNIGLCLDDFCDALSLSGTLDLKVERLESTKRSDGRTKFAGHLADVSLVDLSGPTLNGCESACSSILRQYSLPFWARIFSLNDAKLFLLSKLGMFLLIPLLADITGDK